MEEGENPSLKHLIKLRVDAKIDPTKIDGIIEQTRHALSKGMVLAKENGVSQENIELIILRAVTDADFIASRFLSIARR